MCIRIQKDHICTLNILWSMSEYDGLWKHLYNPACTKSVRSHKNVEVGYYTEEEQQHYKLVHGCIDDKVLHSVQEPQL